MHNFTIAYAHAHSILGKVGGATGSASMCVAGWPSQNWLCFTFILSTEHLSAFHPLPHYTVSHHNITHSVHTAYTSVTQHQPPPVSRKHSRSYARAPTISQRYISQLVYASWCRHTPLLVPFPCHYSYILQNVCGTRHTTPRTKTVLMVPSRVFTLRGRCLMRYSRTSWYKGRTHTHTHILRSWQRIHLRICTYVHTTMEARQGESSQTHLARNNFCV